MEVARRELEAAGWKLGVLDRSLAYPAHHRVTKGKVRGTLYGVAIGDALGAPNEGRRPWRIREPVTGLRPHRGHPAGTVTDDTELTLALAESLLERGGFDPEDLAKRFVLRGARMVGGGRATRAALSRLAAGEPWWRAGTPSAGNGAAMRASPVGLFFEAADEARRVAFFQGLLTHRDRSALAGAIVNALLVGALARGARPEPKLLGWLVEAIRGLEVPLESRLRPGWRYTLAEALEELPEYIGKPEQAFRRYGLGAFVLETLPSALALFLSHPEDPETALLTAANAGFDADTLASLVGGWLGAHLGDRGLRSRTPSNWWAVNAAPEIERLSKLAIGG